MAPSGNIAKLNPNSNGFIDLDRQFSELSDYVGSSDSIKIDDAFFIRSNLHWPNLLQEHRVIILSEAGAGKTEEIRAIASRLRDEGKPAFFLRIESIVDGFEFAFEVGTLEEFREWQASDDEAYLFLDSIDEAKLRDPGDFRRAVTRVAGELRSQFQRTRLFITSRPSAWRPASDLQLCKTRFPFDPPKEPPAKITDDDDQSEEDAVDVLEDLVDPSEHQEAEEASAVAPFRIFRLNDLSPTQIRKFAEQRGVASPDQFLDAIERANAWTFTSRPLDLDSVIAFWRANGGIGSRLELMRHNITRKLEEPQQDYRELLPLSADRAIEGARRLAAALTLMGNGNIRMPDGTQNEAGIDAKVILTDWDDAEIRALLYRPMFDPANYNTVRFHHSSVREYPTAEWLAALLVDGNSRRQIESLCFREKYGLIVPVPTIRPVLPWLALLDAGTLERIHQHAPEIIFEGGDPSRLSFEDRASILTSVCTEIAQGTSGRSMMDYQAVQRFASRDMGLLILSLLEQYDGDQQLRAFLLRMLWHGQISEGVEKAYQVTVQGGVDRYSRVAAIRVLGSYGSVEQIKSAFAEYLELEDSNRAYCLAEFISYLPDDQGRIDLVLRGLQAAGNVERFSSDGFKEAIDKLVAELRLENLSEFLAGIWSLLQEPPVIERRHCEISEEFAWLLAPAVSAAERLISAKHRASFSEPVLHILRSAPLAKGFADIDLSNRDLKLNKLVPGWPKLNWAHFWHNVRATRTSFEKRDKGALDDWWQVAVFGHSWSFGPEDLEAAIEQIERQEALDDQKIALSLAFALYSQADRPRHMRERMKRRVRRSPVLRDTLAHKLRPPAMTRDEKARRRRNSRLSDRRDNYARREAKRHADWKAFLSSDLDRVRCSEPEGPNSVFNHHAYLFERMRDLDPSYSNTRSGLTNWQCLIPDQGEQVATAYRDWLLQHWREKVPPLRSDEAEDSNSTYVTHLIALTGVCVEANENPNWPSYLADDEVAMATRHAMTEINGFPDWLEALFEYRPEIVLDIFLKEVRWDFQTQQSENERISILHDLVYHAPFVGDGIAPTLVSLLRDGDPTGRDALRYCLQIIKASAHNDNATLADLAQRRIVGDIETEQPALWLAIWTSASSDDAIPIVRETLSKLPRNEATQFAMTYLNHLVGDRHEDGAFQLDRRDPSQLKKLYLLMHEYIREEEDIDRSDGRVYSPGPRDNAQRARSTLFTWIDEQPGKAAFLALKDIAKLHPNAESRAWMTQVMRRHAAKDADIEPFQAEQFVDFEKTLEVTPQTHEQLAMLAVERLYDLKQQLEDGDTSIAAVLRRIEREVELRNYIANWCRERSCGRYLVAQEEELPDAKKPDIRFHRTDFDGPVPAELKIAEKWTGPELFERLENQLCRDYLRDIGSARGVFLLVNLDGKASWKLPDGSLGNFDALISALQTRWHQLSHAFPNIDHIEVIGIDLNKRDSSA